MKRLLLISAVLFVVLVVGTATSEATSWFTQDQSLGVNGYGWSFTRVVNHSLNSIVTNTADSYQAYTAYWTMAFNNDWYGGYIFDYSTAKFDYLIYILCQNL